MKSILRACATAVLLTTGLVSVSWSQNDLATQLSKLGTTAARSYVSPILSGWAADLNSGIYYSADLHDVLGFDIGLKLAAARPTDDDKTYTLDLPPTITYNSFTLTRGTDYPNSVTAQTAVGANTQTDIKTTRTVGLIPQGTTILTLPPGFDLPIVPMPAPQLNVGLPLGLEVMARFVPTVSLGDAGKFSMTGFGLRYDVDQWIPLFPVDIAAHFMSQSFKFKDSNDKDVLSASGLAYGVEVSKKLFILTVFGGFQLEKGSFTVASFTGKDPSTGTSITVPEFTVDGNNTSRVTVGVRVLLLFINAHAEYSIAKTPVATLGVGISIR